MSPSFARFDATNGVFSDAIFNGNNPMKSRICANNANLRFGQFGRRASFAAVRRSVFDAIQLVIARGIPAQILQPVIKWISVVMATFHALRARAYKSRQNQRMRFKNFNFVVFPKPQKWAVMSFVFGASFYMPGFDGANSAMIRNFVNSFITNNGFPNFHDCPQMIDMGMIA